jgi:hypothetical protein
MKLQGLTFSYVFSSVLSSFGRFSSFSLGCGPLKIGIPKLFSRPKILVFPEAAIISVGRIERIVRSNQFLSFHEDSQGVRHQRGNHMGHNRPHRCSLPNSFGKCPLRADFLKKLQKKKLISQKLMEQLRIAFVCASNQNRSLEAHAFFVAKGHQRVSSYGTSMQCKLPGPRVDKPNIYPFGTPYKKIYEELKHQNPEL